MIIVSVLLAQFPGKEWSASGCRPEVIPKRQYGKGQPVVEARVWSYAYKPRTVLAPRARGDPFPFH